MQQPDYPSSPSAGAPPNVEHPHAVAARTHDVEPGPVLRFAQELGRLLGATWPGLASVPTGRQTLRPYPRAHGAVPMPEGAGRHSFVTTGPGRAPGTPPSPALGPTIRAIRIRSRNFVLDWARRVGDNHDVALL